MITNLWAVMLAALTMYVGGFADDDAAVPDGTEQQTRITLTEEADGSAGTATATVTINAKSEVPPGAAREEHEQFRLNRIRKEEMEKQIHLLRRHIAEAEASPETRKAIPELVRRLEELVDMNENGLTRIRRKEPDTKQPDRGHGESAEHGGREVRQMEIRVVQAGDRESEHEIHEREMRKREMHERQMHEREMHERNRHEQEAHQQMRRVHVLHEAAERLSAAGLEDAAHELHERAEHMERELQQLHKHHHSEDAHHAIGELAQQVDQLRGEVRELHQKLDRITELLKMSLAKER